MLKEYAVEPAAMGSSWETFRYLIELLTFERGRLISRYPKSWEAEVIAAAKGAGFTPIRLHSVVERLKLSGGRGSIADFGRGYDPSLGSWLVNAVAEHKRLAFHAIISLANAANQNGVVILDDLNDGHPLIKSEHSWEVPRTGAAISSAASLLVKAAQQILIVDPYLDWRDVVTAVRYRESLSAIMTALYTFGRRGVVVQLHYKTLEKRPPADEIIRNSKRLLNGLLPQTFTLELYEWRERANGEDFHDRHLLCDHGGLSIGAGFEAVGAHQHALVTLQPFELSQSLKNRFTPGKAPFDLVGNVIVIASDGTAKQR